MTTKGRLTLLQRAYLLGYKRALARMRRELDVMLKEMKQGWDDEIADLKGVVDLMARSRVARTPRLSATAVA